MRKAPVHAGFGRVAVLALSLEAVILGACSSSGIQVEAISHSVSLHPESSPREALRSGPSQVAILPALAPLQPGLAPLTSMTLMRAVDAAVPGNTVVPASETAGRLNAAGLGTAWHEMAVNYSTGGILDGERLAKVGAATGARWVLMPMLGNLWTFSNNRFTLMGLVVNWTVSTTVDVSLQAWDTRTGQVAWASTGSCTIEAEVILNSRASLNRALETVFRQMVTDLVENRSRSVARQTVPTKDVTETPTEGMQSPPPSVR